MKKYDSIDCALHDQLEVCCIYQYRLCLATRDGRIVTGTAQTTTTDSEKREWLVIHCESRGERVAMDRILQLDVLTPGAKVGRISF